MEAKGQNLFMGGAHPQQRQRSDINMSSSNMRDGEIRERLSIMGEQEWLDLRCRGVRNANAYILVYDICCVDSFEYVKMIRQQIVENREGSSSSSSSSEVPILVVGSKRDLQRQRFTPRRAVSVLVKKTWKCGYVECSAKFNWHVVLLFKELLGSAVARGMRQNHTSIRLQGALQRNRCTLM
ncbi:unnamed protein product [Boreogadus saida]